MCCFLSRIRRLIGKKAKLKIVKWLQFQNSVPFLYALLFFTAFSYLPAAGSFRTSSINVDNKLVNYLSNGGGFTKVEGLRLAERAKSIPPEPDLTQKMKNTLERHIISYRQTASEIHFLSEDSTADDYSKNSTTENGHWRRKRDVILATNKFSQVPRQRRKTTNFDTEGTFVINDVNRAPSQYYDTRVATDINCQEFENKSYVISLENSEDKKFLMIHQLDDKNLKQTPLFKTEAPEAISVEIINIKGESYAFTTVAHDPSDNAINTGSTLYRINFGNKTFDYTQKIHLPFAQSSSFWRGMGGMGKEASEMFLAIAPSKMETETGTTYNVQVKCYRWQGGYFDFVSDLPASNPQRINHFAMFSHDYLAVANYQDDTGSTAIRSEIFKFQHSESRFVSFQKIRTYGAKDIRHFTFQSADERRTEHFIGIANNCKQDENGKSNYWVRSTIMKFGQLRFMPFKSFFSYGAMQFLPVKLGKKFFFTLADAHGIRMFQYNGWTFIETHSMKYKTEQVSPFSLNLRKLTLNDKPYIVVSSTSEGVQNGMFAVNFENRNEHRKLINSVTEWCQNANKTLESKNLEQIENEINSSPKITDENVSIKGTVTFQKGVKINELKSQALKLGKGRSLGEHEFVTMTLNERRFQNLGLKLQTVNTRMGQVVWLNKDQTVSASINFKSFQYSNPTLQIHHLQVQTLSSLKVSEYLDNIVFLDKPESLRTIKTTTVAAQDVNVLTLNGRSISDYALKKPTGRQVFIGRNEFRSDVFVEEEVKVTEEFAGLSFTHPNFLLAVGNQTFPETVMQLTGSKVENLYTRKLNDKDLAFYFFDAVTLTNGHIKSKKHFKSVQVQKADTSTLNNILVQSLYDNAFYTRGKVEQTFIGPAHFEWMEIQELNPSNQRINENFDLSRDFIHVSDGNYQIQELQIKGSTSIKDLLVDKNINNVQVSDGKLQILFANSEEVQHLKQKSVKSIMFTKDVEANERVDGITLSSWSEIVNIQLDQNTIRGKLSSTKSITLVDSLDVSESFHQGNNNVLKTLRGIAPLDNVMLPGLCDLNFEDLEVKGNTEILGFVDGVKPSQWVVNSEAEEVIVSGEKTFSNVKIKKNVRAQALFGRREGGEDFFRVLPNMVLDGVDQTISQKLAFKHLLKVNQANCPNSILNGIPFDNLLFKKGNQEVHIDSFFREPLKILGGASVVGVMHADLINGINFDHELRDTLRTGEEFKEQTVLADYSFSEIITKDAKVQGSFASSDVNSIFNHIVLKNSKEITVLNANQLIFQKGAKIDRFEYVGWVNGITELEWGQTWLLDRTNQVITTKVQFLGPITGNNVKAQTVNNIDVETLSSEVVRIDSDETFNGKVIFLNPAQAMSGIATADEATLNGVNLRRDVLLKSSPEMQTISGKKDFMQGFTVNGDMTVRKIPNFDITNFAELLHLDHTQPSGSSLVVNGNMVLEREPQFDSVFNGHDWNNILESVWFRDKDVMIQGPVQFSKLVLERGGELHTAKMNGRDLNEFEKNYASKTRNQEWKGSVVLHNVNQMDSLSTKSLTVDNGKFNGVDIKTFYDSVLRYSQDQVIRGPLRVNSLQTVKLNANEGTTINSKRLQDLMTISGPNQVTSKKGVKNIHAKTIVLTPETVIDGVNLGEWNDNAVKRSGDQVIKGPVQFASLQTVNNVKVDGLVDGVKYDVDNVLTTDLDQEIFGEVTIVHGDDQSVAPALTAPGGLIIKGTLNGINVQQSVDNFVFRNDRSETPIRIKGKTEFNSPVVLNEITTESLLQGHDVREMMGRFSRAHDQITNTSFNGAEQYQKLLNVANKMLRVSEKRAMFLEHFVLTQTIQVPSSYVKVINKVGYQALAIGFKKSQQTTTENWWSYSPAVDYYQLQIGNRVQLDGIVTDVAELGSGQEHMFVFAVNSEDGRPASTSLEKIASVQNFEVNKSEDKFSKAFVLKTVDSGTSRSRPAISQIIYSNGFKSLRSVSVESKDGVTDCVLATMETTEEMDNAVKMFCLNRLSGELETVQEINFDSPSMTTSVRASDKTLLGILTRSSDGQPEGLLEIWGNVKNAPITFSKQHCLPVFNVVSLDSISTSEGKIFLAVASGTLRKTDYKGSVFIYRYSEVMQEFKKLQTIEVNHPIDVKLQWLKRSNEIVTYILSDSITDNVQVYKYQGLSGWNLAHQFTSEGGKSLQVTDFSVDGIYKAQLLVTSPTETNIYSAEFMGINTVVEETLENLETMRIEGSSSLQENIDVDNL